MITPDEYGYFAGRALDGMASIVRELGDDRANRRPNLRGANSPYALLTHCLGVVETWSGWFVAGRHYERDRDAEFLATGAVEPLLARLEVVKARLLADAAQAAHRAPLVAQPPKFAGPDRELTQGAALMHVYEELAQHHGQMQLIRDILILD